MEEDNKDTKYIDPNKPARRRWLMPLLIALGILLVGVITFFAFNAISDDPNDTTVLNDLRDSKDTKDTTVFIDSTASPAAAQPVEAPAPTVASSVEVVDEAVEDGYSVAYAGALNLYNSRKYAECKSECQKLLRQYTSREQKQQLNQLIEYCDTALAAEETARQAAALEQQYQSDYNTAEYLYNQKRYSECKSRCQSMLSSYPSHRGEINALISKCDSAISAQQAAEQAAAPSRLPDRAVDLGLSVLWADRNVGASSPSDYGGYYAWGETTTKRDYRWSTYTHCDGKWKNCHNIGSNIAGTRYDVARQKWGGGWKLPTKSQWQELIDNCTWTWTTQGGHRGYMVTSKKNGNSIFLPAAGYRDGTSSVLVGSYGNYWSSTHFELYATDAWCLYFNSDRHRVYYNFRNYGYSVRPVCNK